jgi:hypothetical protein
MMEKHFEAAAAVASIAWLLAKDRNDLHEIQEGAPVLLKKTLTEATESLPQPSSGATCDFCGKGPPEVRTVQGPKARICNECIQTIGEVLSRE